MLGTKTAKELQVNDRLLNLGAAARVVKSVAMRASWNIHFDSDVPNVVAINAIEVGFLPEGELLFAPDQIVEVEVTR